MCSTNMHFQDVFHKVLNIMVFSWKKSAQYFQIGIFNIYHAYVAISSLYDLISFLLGGSSLDKDHGVQYFTTDKLQVIFYKAHLKFPLALHIKIRFYTMLLDTAYRSLPLQMGHSESDRDFHQLLPCAD